jgi:hypothetical protein
MLLHNPHPSGSQAGADIGATGLGWRHNPNMCYPFSPLPTKGRWSRRTYEYAERANELEEQYAGQGKEGSGHGHNGVSADGAVNYPVTEVPRYGVVAEFIDTEGNCITLFARRVSSAGDA